MAKGGYLGERAVTLLGKTERYAECVEGKGDGNVVLGFFL